MNERINELIKQSYKTVQFESGYSQTYFSQEKFAELIVRECLGKVAEAAHARRDPFFAYSQILEHFGVEE
jgi:hypothetical protein